VSDEGDKDALGAGAGLDPVSEIFCGLLDASSAMPMAPVRVPPAVGVNFTLMVQLDPAVRVAAHPLVCAKSPEAEIPEMFRTALPELVRVED
jgi:hypothetical protein